MRNRFTNSTAFFLVRTVLLLTFIAYLFSAVFVLGNYLFGWNLDLKFNKDWRFSYSIHQNIAPTPPGRSNAMDSALLRKVALQVSQTYGPNTVITADISRHQTATPEATSATAGALQANRFDNFMFFFSRILGIVLIAWCSWHLLRSLDFIRKGDPFSPANYRSVLMIGYGMVTAEVLYILLALTSYLRQANVTFSPANTDYSKPFSLLSPTSPFQLSWLIAGYIIILVASAFKKGTILQTQHDLTA